MDIFIAAPEGNTPDKKYLNFAREYSRQTGSKIVLTSNLDEGLEGADIVYANTWTPMHLDSALKEHCEKTFKDYQINETTIKKAHKDVIFMHCLPCFRGKEITDAVIESSRLSVSRSIDDNECRGRRFSCSGNDSDDCS